MITGANGFMGQHISKWLKQAGYEILATGKGQCRIPFEINYHSLDVTDKQAVNDFIRNNDPNMIVHTAAMSKPDDCNLHRNLCMEINVEATKYLLQNFDGHFIYISSDFVFGENGPHAETDSPAPLNFYGESKWMAEKAVLEKNLKATIVRPVFMYGKIWTGLKPTFLHWVKNNLLAGNKIKVTADQFRTPTYIEDICKGIERILFTEALGTYHLAGKNIISPFEMAIKLAELLSLDASLIEAVTADTFQEPVIRAKRSGLLIDKARKELGYEPLSFEEGIRRSFAEE